MRAKGAVLRAYAAEVERLRECEPGTAAVIEEYVAALRDESASRRVRVRALEAELRLRDWEAA